MNELSTLTGQLTELRGVAGAPGIALGRAHHIDRPHIRVPRYKLPADSVQHELKRLENSIELSRHQLAEAKRKLSLEEHHQIIDAHLTLFEDPELVARIRKRVQELTINTEWAVTQIIAEVTSVFDHVQDPYLKERRRDFEYVERRLLVNLMGIKQESIEEIREPVILVAHDLSPADLAHASREFILGIATDVGGATSHTTILARAMEIPTVVGLEKVTETVKTGELIVLDGFDGKIILNPSMEVIGDYETRREHHRRFEQDLRLIRDVPAQTADGSAITLAANIELPSELDVVRNSGLTRIGLFRTEFLFLFSAHSPSEDEQFEVYRNVVQRLGPEGETTIRTIDLGGDKANFGNDFAGTEANPAMGLRAIRLCLANPAVFRTQLRAILRASAYGRIRIMFPMISGIEELRSAKALVDEARGELRRDGIAFDENIAMGIMVETPAAALTADLLAPEAAFFSIGTNDLIQYTLAVDRGNEHVNYLFHPLHPAVLRAIARIVEAGHAAGIPVAMCGEMAGQPEYVMALLGLGVDELSMAPNRALHIKRLISHFTRAEAVDIVRQAMKLDAVQQVNDLIVGHIHKTHPEEFGL